MTDMLDGRTHRRSKKEPESISVVKAEMLLQLYDIQAKMDKLRQKHRDSSLTEIYKIQGQIMLLKVYIENNL